MKHCCSEHRSDGLHGPLDRAVGVLAVAGAELHLNAHGLAKFVPLLAVQTTLRVVAQVGQFSRPVLVAQVCVDFLKCRKRLSFVGQQPEESPASAVVDVQQENHSFAVRVANIKMASQKGPCGPGWFDSSERCHAGSRHRAGWTIWVWPRGPQTQQFTHCAERHVAQGHMYLKQPHGKRGRFFRYSSWKPEESSAQRVVV